MDFDDALREVGQWGRYQMQFYLMVSMPVLFKGFQVMLLVFTVYVPNHRCAIPGLENDTYRLQSETHRQQLLQAIPSTLRPDGTVSFDPCLVYTHFNISHPGYIHPGYMQDQHSTPSSSDQGYGSIASNKFDNDSDGGVTTNGFHGPTQSCQRWVYDTSELMSTLITDFDLVCEKKDIRAHSNMMMMAGFLAGSTIASFLCDWLGRKRIYCCCLVIMMIFGIASAFPSSPEMLLVFRFLSGLGLMGVMVSGFVLVVEMIGGSMRTKLGAAWQIVWLVGPFVLAVISYGLRHWQHLQLVGSVPPVVFLVYWWLVPESPRWLVSKGRVSEAVVTLKKVAKVNGKTCPSSVEDQLKRGGSKHQHVSESVSPVVIFQHPKLLVRFLIIIFNWAVISMTYYGLSLNVSNLSGGIRINFFASCIVELIGYMVAVFLLDRLGRKWLHSLSMLSAGVSCLLTIFTVMYLPEDHQWTTTALAMIGKLGVSSSFAIIFLYSAELYPTVLRNFGVGCGSMFARIGSMLSPYIADLAIYIEGDFSTAVPLIVFGALALGAGLSSLLLPETLHRKLPDTVHEAIHFGRYEQSEVIDEEKMTASTSEDNEQKDEEEEEEELKSHSLKHPINGPDGHSLPLQNEAGVQESLLSKVDT